MKKTIKWLGIGILGVVLITTFNSFLVSSNDAETVCYEDTISTFPNIKYGLAIDSFVVFKKVIKKNQFLAEILLRHHIPYARIEKIVRKALPVFDIKNIRAGKNYTILCSNDSLQKAQYFVYEQSPVNFIVFDFRDTIKVYKGKNEVTVKERMVSGTIKSSLYEALMNTNSSPALVMNLATIYAWTIDFYRIQKGDAFKVIYEEQFVGNQSIGVGEIKAAYFKHWNNEFYAFGYDTEIGKDYYDENGKSLRKTFLKSPLKFSTITSRYSLKRYHPVQKRNKPHYGTDYAAPRGTPIMAVGDGKVIESKRSKYNGNYVKIKHNETYTTQYLHMSKRAVRVGQYVKQGNIIGYVGSTGLATGPHVCFRFWKHGKQVDHLKEKFPASNPIPFKHKKGLFAFRDSMQQKMEGI